MLFFLAIRVSRDAIKNEIRGWGLTFWVVSEDQFQQNLVAERSGHFRPPKRSWPLLGLSVSLRVLALGYLGTGKALVHCCTRCCVLWQSFMLSAVLNVGKIGGIRIEVLLSNLVSGQVVRHLWRNAEIWSWSTADQ